MEKLFVRIRWILRDPSDFFAKLSSETHIRDSAVYLITLTFISSMLNYLLTISSGWDLGLFRKFFMLNLPLPGIGPVRFAMLGLTYTLFLIILSYIVVFLLSGWMYLFGVRASYKQAYQLLAYSLTPNYLLGWIDWRLGVLSWIWVLGLLVVGSRNMFQISRRKSWFMFTLPAVLSIAFLAVVILWLAKNVIRY